MTVTLVLAASLLLQFLAAYYALRLIRVSGHSLAWSLITVAIVLMALRRGTSFYEVLTGASAKQPDLTVELIALLISILMAVGIERIGPIFSAIKANNDRLLVAEQEIRKFNQELERRVEERTAQLEAAYREMEAFSYSVSHDLRAPLRAISGYSRILAEDCEGQLGGDARDHLDHISTNVLRMEQMIEDILQFSRMARQDLSSASIDMRALAADVFAEIRATAPQCELRFNLGPLPAALGDRSMIRQVLANLLGNAVKFSAQRPLAVIEMDAAAGSEPHMATYRIADNGVGFDMQYADRLFGVFQRLHRNQEFEGTGIGLAIAKRIVERHGGRIWAEGRPDAGATVFFTLPLANDGST